MQPLKPGKHSTSGISQYNDTQNQDLSTVWLVCMHYVWKCIRVCVCVCVWGCPVQLLSEPYFLPAFFKPKLHGAAYGKGIYLSPISSISFGYSGRKRFLRPAPPPPFFLLILPPCWLRTLCVCNMAWLSPWNTSFSLVGALHANRPALCCVSIFGVLGPWAFYLSLRATYHTIHDVVTV